MKKFFIGVTVFTVLLLSSCQQPETSASDAGDQQTMDSLMTAYEGAWESSDPAAFDEILAPTFSRSVNEGASYGIDSLKRVATDEGGLQNLSIDLREKIYDVNRAAVSWTLNGTMGGQSITTTGASFVTFEDGLIASERVVLDTAPIAELMMQGGGDGGAAADTSAM